MQPDKSGFIVLNCRRGPNVNNKLVCVPKAWIKCPMPGTKVAFRCPVGNEDSLAETVENNAGSLPDPGWQMYIGEIIFESETYESAVGYLQAISEEDNMQIEDNNNQKSCEEAVVDKLQTVCEGNSKQIEEKSNAEPYEDAGGHLQHIEDNTNEKSYEDAGGHLLHLEDNSNQKSCEETDGYLQTSYLENNIQIEETSNAFEPVTDPKNPLIIRMVRSKPDQKADYKKKSEKKRHRKHSKEHLKDKVRKSKRRYMGQLDLTDNIAERSYVITQDRESNCQSSESSPKSTESEISNIVNSVETHFKINNNISYSSKRILPEIFDAETENNGMMCEDRQLVKNMYMEIMRYVEYMEKKALEIKTASVIATANKRIVEQLAAKYRIPLAPVETVNKRIGDPFEEENLQDNDIETQCVDIMENEEQATIENDSTSAENLLEESLSAGTLLDTDFQIVNDDEYTDDLLLSSAKVVTYQGTRMVSKENDTRTLKHKHAREGLIEIGRNSGVYISRKGLAEAKRISKDVKQFARNLYREGFTSKALRTCSMTGFTRPALHYKARTILKNYAMIYGQHAKWESVGSKELENTMMRFLHNYRRNINRDEMKKQNRKKHLK